ncbi:pantoate--beta-alanine ligase [Virgibacillus oceani]|uniref:Pantothenate synthetase n=1 Tax=Virgibacillus oceani TaxID=1479511 RepID=A0A917LZB1_9BACI|nr:pantoate--beta-alanine ligase [Virgibacillus oceani]GGG65462.1 pantothenate synthetase [Virgibacillus oceani]
MEIIRTVNEMQTRSLSILQDNKTIGFVPTMGFFHEGHLSLMKEAKKENDLVVTSIFVNPLQFGPNEDYDNYPRNEKMDAERAKEVGADILFMPGVRDMYPKKMMIDMSINERVNVLCGRSRPGHFEGILTVLSKLFNIIKPNKTYFGMKDAQQVAVVDALVQDLNFPIELVALPTIREADGLAKSSRNVNLSKAERKEAIWLHKALKHGQRFVVDGEKNPAIIEKEVKKIIENETSGSVDYVELLSYPELKNVSFIDQQVILATAVFFERARLIDNLILNADGSLVKQIK